MRVKAMIPALGLGLALSAGLPGDTTADTIISKSVSYFSISGKTAEDLDRELGRRGPLAKSTGMRHPGATRIKFGGTVTYQEGGGRCAVRDAKVTLSTKIILPRWQNRKRANADMALIWDTLAADIKRHEERHAEIARNHARDLEKALVSLGTARNCAILKARVASVSEKAIEAHSADQRRCDRIEAANFENRMVRLLKYRLGKLD